MLFDQTENSLCDQVVVFPDFSFGGVPRAEPLVEIDVIGGDNTTTVDIRGDITSE